MEPTAAAGLPATDTRGILNPRRMAEHVALHRVVAPPDLAGLVDWFWSVVWSLPEGVTHSQDVVSQPGVNLSVGPAPPPGSSPPAGPHPVTAKVNGVSTRRSTRVLSGTGWTVAAKTTSGGFAAWYPRPMTGLTDRILEPQEIWPDVGRADTQAFVTRVDAARVGLSPERAAKAAGAEIAALLRRRLETADPARVALAREAARITALVEADRSIGRVEELADRTGTGVRTLQRLFAECVGVSPKWLIRRHRLLEAAERARDGARVDWASVAAELGYADQAHLTREFRSVIGETPAAYAAGQRSDGP